MAEFVEFRAEEWISELEQMERIRLFEPNEIKSIATKRREFEYKIQRKTKFKEDYLRYIQFEIDLHKIIVARREKNQIYSKKAEIDYSQSHRIARLFKNVIFKFQDDIKLWMSFFKFCKDVKFFTLVSQMLVRMLQIHSNKPDMWIFASKWELEQCNMIENARQYLTRGLRHHPSSEVLYEELFKLELEHRKKKENEKEMKVKADKWIPDEVNENIIEGKLVEVVYRSAVKTIATVEFKARLLEISKEYENTLWLQNLIFEDMMKCHSTEELTWDAMAKRELEGISSIAVPKGDDESMDVDCDKESNNISYKERIIRSNNVYEEAVKKLDTSKMWSFYLDHVMEINKKISGLPMFRFKILRNAFEGALAANKMEEKYFLSWVKILEKNKGKYKKLCEVLQKGTEQYPESLKLWHARLRLHLSRDQEKTGLEVFREAVKHLPDAVPIWKLMIQYLLLKSSSQLEEIAEEGIRQYGEVAQTLKPMYMEWIVLTKGIEQGRVMFETTQFQHPPCLELYTKMAQLESVQPEVSLKNIRRCHELSCSNFGSKKPDVWLNYIKFEMSKGDVTKVSHIYTRALKTLEPQFADEFVAEYSVIKIKTP